MTAGERATPVGAEAAVARRRIGVGTVAQYGLLSALLLLALYPIFLMVSMSLRRAARLARGADRLLRRRRPAVRDLPADDLLQEPVRGDLRGGQGRRGERAARAARDRDAAGDADPGHDHGHGLPAHLRRLRLAVA